LEIGILGLKTVRKLLVAALLLSGCTSAQVSEFTPIPLTSTPLLNASPTQKATQTPQATPSEEPAPPKREPVAFEELISVELVRENLSTVYQGGYYVEELPIQNRADYLVLDFSTEGWIVVKDGAADLSGTWGLYIIKVPVTDQTAGLGPGSGVPSYLYHLKYFNPEMAIAWADLPIGTQIFMSVSTRATARPELSVDEVLPLDHPGFLCEEVEDYLVEYEDFRPAKISGMLCEFTGQQ
jgi:hypothetical protein